MAKKAIAVLGGMVVKTSGKWRTTTYQENDNFGVLGDRYRVIAASHLFKNARPVSDLIIIASGGKAQLEHVAEAPTLAEVIAKELEELGVDKVKIFKEDKSGNTYQQLLALNKLIFQLKLGKIIIISNEYHLPRIQAMIEVADGLEVLRKMLTEKTLKLESAEKILLKYDRPNWEIIISEAYSSSAMKERIQLEEKGIQQIRTGTYKFK